ncbi:MAG: NADH dehydrogenase subunit [Akkermansiaceae bacterium]|nr:NADH dehydrogenase subunit [Akkermansiaceae bacterium]
MSIIDKVREAGVVGAGGAGFPAHVKLDAKVDYVLANGAECEPLLHKDAELTETYIDQVIRGMELSMEATGAPEAIFGIKAKRTRTVAALENATAGKPIKVQLFGDYYPAGDEFVLVYECTGRLIPAGGIPLQVGAVVHNSETLLNMAEAMEGRPVTRKILTVTGEVANPMSLSVPVGITLQELIEIAGGATTPDYTVFVGGLMMGRIESDLSKPVTKTTGGLIVLPSDHRLVTRMTTPNKAMHRIGKSACDQCSYCTEFCPRYLLGYDVQPHKVMRTLGFTATGKENWSKWADLCCSCGLCTLYSCPEDLFPKEACDQAIADRKEAGLERWLGPTEEITAHPMESGRHVPLKALMQKLGVKNYDRPAPWHHCNYQPRKVTLPLSQHLGAPAEVVVGVGDRVGAGQVIAEIPEGKLAARLHASIEGTVTAVNGSITIEQS